MGDRTGIEWTDATWNPIRGCSKVSAGCANCYAEGVAARFSGPGLPYEGLTTDGRWNGKIKLVRSKLDQPIRWKRPRLIFVNSMSDLFHPSVPPPFVDQVWAVMLIAARLRGHVFQVLTKRPERMAVYLNAPGAMERIAAAAAGFGDLILCRPTDPRIWLGVSVEAGNFLDRFAELEKCPAALRWVSVEPILGNVKIPGWIQWVVAGGESGPNARPAHPSWIRNLRDQCAALEIPFLFKQWGEWLPDRAFDGYLEPDRERVINLAGGSGVGGLDHWVVRRVGKRAAGRRLDGEIHNAYPVI